MGLTRSNPKSISGGNSIKESAEIFMNILNNKGTNSQNEVIFANSGLAISTALGISLNEGIEKAKESLLSNQALKTFNNLKKLC
jgi:anthranilate phosphoribosyltransferase